MTDITVVNWIWSQIRL